ncbi:MAG TPA: dioxygenase, partial [Mycobacterium sp.]|nr:dioxygenase [Mycobacterium sp.]
MTPSGRSPDGQQRRFATLEGGEQLAITEAARRRLLEIGVGADDPDDLDRIESNLARLGAEFRRSGEELVVHDPHSALRVSIKI